MNARLLCFVAGLTLPFLAGSVLRAAPPPFTPSNPPDMQPLTNRNSPAYHAAKLFRRGVNLGDYLEAAWPNATRISARDFTQMHAEGFDHVRIPVGWHRYAGPAPEFALRSNIFARVDFVVTNALANQLAVIINIHHFNEFDRDPPGNVAKLTVLWRQIAAHYADAPPSVAFELDNEPHENATTAVVNGLYPQVIAEIRKTNPHRTLFVEPGNWGGIDEITNLVLPPDDNLIVSGHCYDPFFFTHQGTSWTGPDQKQTGFQFPGPPRTPLVPDPSLHLSAHALQLIEQYNTLAADRNPSSPVAFRSKLQRARAWSDYYGRPVHIGEFGCYYRVDPDSRARFHAAFRRALDEANLGWAVWDWNANFRYWDPQADKPMPGMREALFGK